ncbi:hypothetical protein STEG23_003607, partial [Scotinomys teguina]
MGDTQGQRGPCRNCRSKMTQQMQNLHLSQSKKHSAPSSPNAAKRLYRNLSEKLKGSHSSFDEAYFKTRTDRLSLRKTSMNFQGNEAMFEAVEQQDLDAVQLLLYQYTPEELDLNTPNSEGLTPLDIAIMTNNVPIARILLRTGARESPHFVSRESRAMHLNTLVQEAQDRVSELSAQVENEGFTLDNTEKEKQLKAWEWRYRLYRRMKTGFEHARAPEVPANACLMVTSSTSLTVSFQEPLSVNAAVVTRYKVSYQKLIYPPLSYLTKTPANATSIHILTLLSGSVWDLIQKVLPYGNEFKPILHFLVYQIQGTGLMLRSLIHLEKRQDPKHPTYSVWPQFLSRNKKTVVFAVFKFIKISFLGTYYIVVMVQERGQPILSQTLFETMALCGIGEELYMPGWEEWLNTQPILTVTIQVINHSCESDINARNNQTISQGHYLLPRSTGTLETKFSMARTNCTQTTALPQMNQCFRVLDWKDYDDREPRHKGQSEVLESLLQQVRALHQHYSCR